MDSVHPSGWFGGRRRSTRPTLSPSGPHFPLASEVAGPPGPLSPPATEVKVRTGSSTTEAVTRRPGKLRGIFSLFRGNNRRAGLFTFLAIILAILLLILLAKPGQIRHGIVSMEVAIDNALGTREEDQRRAGTSQAMRGQGSGTTEAVWSARKLRIREAFRVSWAAYRNDAWGKDEYCPVSRTGTNLSEEGGVGFTVVDALDTLYLMGLTEEFDEAVEWVSKELDFSRPGPSSLFEVTIRVLGGLLSAFHLSGSKELIRQAITLANHLLPAYDSPSGVPWAHVDLRRRVAVQESGTTISLAEAGTLQLEMRYLSWLTKDWRYWEASTKAMTQILSQVDENGSGLLPLDLDPRTGKFLTDQITLSVGARGDSYYEYLLKQWIQTNQTEARWAEEWDRALAGIRSHLLHPVPNRSDLVFLTDEVEDGKGGRKSSNHMDHLACFLPGTMALAATQGKTMAQATQMGKMNQNLWKEAERLLGTCWQMHQLTLTGLTPDGVTITSSGLTFGAQDASNILRPETLESMFVLYRLSGQEVWRTRAWSIFESMERYARVPSTGSFTSLDDVRSSPPALRDRLETFFFVSNAKEGEGMIGEGRRRRG